MLIWDGLPCTDSARMRDWIASQRAWLPGRAAPRLSYDINPIEQVGGSLQSKELRNFCPDTLDEVANVAEDGLNRIGSDASLCFAFLHHSGLRL